MPRLLTPIGAAALLAACCAAPAAAEVRSVRIADPRPFGYFIGDVIRRHVEIVASADDEIVTASLPRPGPVNYWLDLKTIDVTESTDGDARRYGIALAYQTFYAPLETRQVSIPPITLQVRSGDKTAAATVPAFAFVTSPVRALFTESQDKTSPVTLRPDSPARRVPTGGVRTAMVVFGAGSLISLGLFAHHLAWWPFRRRPGRPFTEALRRIEAVQSEDRGTKGYTASLLLLHRAFDEAAGERLLAEDLPGFMKHHPEFEKDQAAIGRFFESSRRVFFSDDLSGGIAVLPPGALTALAGELAHQEQRA